MREDKPVVDAVILEQVVAEGAHCYGPTAYSPWAVGAQTQLYV